MNSIPLEFMQRVALLLVMTTLVLDGHRIVQLLTWSELDTFARRDVDLLAGLRVDPSAGGCFAHRERAETNQANVVAALEAFANGLESGIDQISGLFDALVGLGGD